MDNLDKKKIVWPVYPDKNGIGAGVDVEGRVSEARARERDGGQLSGMGERERWLGAGSRREGERARER